ncbi:hypothetical protein ACF0H5_020349 [Mactra antiquata]
MNDSETIQMIYRYLRRRKGYILILVLTVVCLYILSGGFDSLNGYSTVQDYDTSCVFPCYGDLCPKCETTVPPTVKVINIAEHLKLKQALRNFQLQKSVENVSSSETVCKRPSFDLNHDSVKYAFFHMDSLNCSREELFYVDNGVFKMKQNVLKGRVLEKCDFFGIERALDDFASYTDPVTKKDEPFDVKLSHDFVRIKCFLKEEETDNDKDDINIELGQKLSEDQDGISKRLNEKEKHSIKPLNGEDSAIDKDKLTDNKIDKSKISEAHIDVQRVIRQAGVRHLNRFIGDNEENNELDIENNDNEDGDRPFYNDDEDHDPDSNEFYGRDYWYNQYEEENADFDQFLVQISPKKDILKLNEDTVGKVKSNDDTDDKMNVLMFGLDSMSHLAYQRKLPLTYKYLKEELGAVVMDGYNIVGDATTAALIPMLTGKTETELPEVRRNRWESENVDVYPLIWKQFKSKGYATLFAEDEPTIGVFNLRLNGFRDQPTDHYMRPFWQALWDTELRRSSPRYCTGNVPHHMYLLNYLKDFYVKYSNVSKFAFVFGSELTHWDNNPGEYMDADFMNFFQFLKKGGYLDNTVVIAFADHGARYSRVRKTVQGKMEERLPFMSVAMPKKFRKKYPKVYRNLLKNSDKLTTPFDVHETLLDILDLNRLKNTQKVTQRGLSLLRPVPPSRTCTDAQIQMHWCTCLKQIELDAGDKYVQKSVNALIKFLNKVTESQRQLCAELRFHSLIHAFLLIPNEKVLMFQKSRDEDNRYANFSSNVVVDHAHFQVTIETLPNKGLYESTIQVNMTSGDYTVIEDEVSRLDMYGNQPACVQDKYPDLRKYCYCMKQSTRNL